MFCIISISLLQAANNEKNNGIIKGVVIDKSTQKPLQGVNIIIQGTERGTISGSAGNFRIQQLPVSTYSLAFSYIGYSKKKVQNITVESDKEINIGMIELSEEPIKLSDVVVTPGQFSIMGTMPLSQQTLASKDIKNMSFAEDITRAVSRLPGVSSNDFSSKFTVRGGEADEVLMLLDGMELYEPFHQRDFSGGLFSIVDIEAIEGVDLLTGGFSAEYGNRQSAVFNMKTKQMATGERHTSIGLSIMNTRIYTEGTLPGNKGNYLFSVRKCMLDQTFKLIGETENMPSFYDMMGKVEIRLNPKHSLSFHALHAGDKTAVRDIVPEAHDIHDTRYTNSYSWLTLKSVYSPKLYSRTLLYGGLVNHDRRGNTAKDEYSDKLNFQLKDKRRYNFVGIKQDWNWNLSDRVYLKSGLDVRQLNADYNYSLVLDDVRINTNDSLVNYSSNINIRKKPAGQQAAAYVSSRFLVLPKLFLETGLRYDYASYTDDKLLSPRISLAYTVKKNTILRSAWGYYYQTQFINNLDVNHNSGTFNPAELSTHYVLSLEHLFKNGINFRIEGYYKDISNLSATYQNLRDPWEVYPESRNDVIKLNIDGASAKGIEVFMKYDTGDKISWWFSYALATADENITNIEFEGLLTERTGTLPRINNQHHTIYCDVNYRPNAKWLINLSWQYYIGWPMTLYEYDFQTLPDGKLHFYPVHTKFRADEYPPYHRMDLRINRHFYLKHSKLSAYLHIINLYNRQNLRKFDLDVTGDNGQTIPDGQGGYIYPRDDKNWFGITPVIGFSWEF